MDYSKHLSILKIFYFNCNISFEIAKRVQKVDIFMYSNLIDYHCLHNEAVSQCLIKLKLMMVSLVKSDGPHLFLDEQNDFPFGIYFVS